MDLFVVCLGIGAGFVIISFLAGNLLETGDIHADGIDFADAGSIDADGAGLDTPDTQGFQLLTLIRPVTIALFLTLFGAAGIICRNLGAPFVASAAAGTVAGLVFTNLLHNLIMKPLRKYSGTSSSKKQELIGLPAKVTLKITGNSYGKIVYTRKGNTYSSPAVTEEANKVFNVGDIVEIKHIERGKFFVGERVVAPAHEDAWEPEGTRLQ